MGTLPSFLQPRARKTGRIQLPLDNTRISLPELKAHHARRVANAADNSPVGGCVSSLSVPRLQRADFKTAVAEFAGLRQGASVEYNHVAITAPQSFPDIANIEASAEVFDAMSQHQDIDSDLIEECGYFGWLAGTARNA